MIFHHVILSCVQSFILCSSSDEITSTPWVSNTEKQEAQILIFSLELEILETKQFPLFMSISKVSTLLSLGIAFTNVNVWLFHANLLCSLFLKWWWCVHWLDPSRWARNRGMKAPQFLWRTISWSCLWWRYRGEDRILNAHTFISISFFYFYSSSHVSYVSHVTRFTWQTFQIRRQWEGRH